MSQIERYSSVTMLEMLQEVEQPSSFFTQTFFPNELMFTTQSVEWDIVRKGRALAPFVSPTVRGRPYRPDGYATRSLRPAYVKQSSIIDPYRPLARKAGEMWGGSLTPAQRLDMIMMEEMEKHDKNLKLRMEWMAVNSVINGGYTVSGEEFPAYEVNFDYDPNLFVTLAGALTWDLPTARPLDDIERLASQVRTISYGAVCTDVIMDRQAWEFLRAHQSTTDLLNLDIKRSDLAVTNFDLGIRSERYGNGVGAEVVATVAGRFRIWVYEAYYEDNDGVTRAFMPENTVIVAAPAETEGHQLYGAILDADAGYQASKMWMKSRDMWDPTGTEILSSSAPLVAPKRVNTHGVMTVA